MHRNIKETLFLCEKAFSSCFSFFIMPKLISIVLCILFLNQTAMSLWVLVDFYAHQEEIAIKECINRFKKQNICKGKCVLTNRLQQFYTADKRKDSSNKDYISAKKTENHPFVILIKKTQIANLHGVYNRPTFFVVSHYKDAYLSQIFHPPPYC